MTGKLYRVYTALCLLAALLGLSVAAAQGQGGTKAYLINCLENQLDAALATAENGDSITFVCPAQRSIRVTSPKIVSKNIRINGAGITLDGAGGVPVLKIAAGATVTLTDLVITRGKAEAAEGNGGGLDNRGTVTLTRVIFEENEQAIFNGRNATVTISNSLIRKNEQGLLNYGGVVTINSVLFAENARTGLYNSGRATVIGSTFTGNRSGIDNTSGTLTVANSSFVANKNPAEDGFGAGITNSGQALVLNSTFTHNEAASGGAIGNHKNGVILLRNTILANSPQGRNCSGTINNGSNNLQYPGESCGASIPSADPQVILPALQNELRPLPIALESTSPAIGKGNPIICRNAPVNNVDQRGLPRIMSENRCDIGAYEFHANPNLETF